MKIRTKLQSYVHCVVLPSAAVILISNASSALALERYQAYMGIETVIVEGLGSSGTNNCSEVFPPEGVAPYNVGQDVEFRFEGKNSIDIANDGQYTRETICFMPNPIAATAYGYGNGFENTLSDLAEQQYNVRKLYQVISGGPAIDGYIYVSNTLQIDTGWQKISVADFVQKFEAGDYDANYGKDRLVISTLFAATELRGGAGNDWLISVGGRDKLYGENGNDIMDGMQEDINYLALIDDPNVDQDWSKAEFWGGSGDDVYYLRDSADKAIELPGEGFDIAFCAYNYGSDYPDFVMGKGGYHFSYDTDIEVIAGDCASLPPNFTGRYFPKLFLQPFEVLALNGKGSSLSDAVKYYEDSLAFDAGAGDDLVVTGGGDDNVAGGTGNDIMSPGDGNDQVSGGDGDDIVVDTEGSDEASPAAPFAAVAMAGVPRLMAGMPAGAFGDYFDGGAGTDTLRYSVPRSEATVTPQPDGSVAVEIGSSRDVLLNVERLQFTDQTIQVGNDSANKITGTNAADKLFGFAGNDKIIGNGGNDEIDGGTGADSMSGGDGDDSYIVDNAGDKVKETARPASGTDTVYTALPAYTMPANVENLVYTGAAGFSGKGNKSGNRMSGGPAADRLDGQKGNDVMIGLGGDDSYVVDSLADLVTEEPGGGYDAVIASVTITTLSQNVEALTLSKGNINGTGNALDNLIIGSTSQNVLSGGDGADTLIGGLGNDSFYGETSAAPGDDADTISYAGAKKAIVFSLANTLAAQNTGGAGTDRIYDNSSIENLTGSAFNDTLTGNTTNNVLSGTDGNDTLLGLAGADVLVGGKGLDLIDAGADADVDRVTYLVPTDSPPGATFRDQVTNFTPGTDLIDLSSIDANTAVDGDQAFAFNGTTPAANAVWYAVLGPDIVLGGDVNGDAIPDFEVLMKGVQSLHGSDLVP